MLEEEGGWVGKYSPGWPILLLPFVHFGIKTFANPLLNGLTLILFGWLLRQWTTQGRALVGVMLLVTSPFFVKNGQWIGTDVFEQWKGDRRLYRVTLSDDGRMSLEAELP